VVSGSDGGGRAAGDPAVWRECVRLLPTTRPGGVGWRAAWWLKLDALNQWVTPHRRSIGPGPPSALVNSPVVQKHAAACSRCSRFAGSQQSHNASHLLGHASCVEGMESLDSSAEVNLLHLLPPPGAALVAVMQNLVDSRAGDQERFRLNYP